MQPSAINGRALQADAEIGVRRVRVWGEPPRCEGVHLIEEELRVLDGVSQFESSCAVC